MGKIKDGSVAEVRTRTTTIFERYFTLTIHNHNIYQYVLLGPGLRRKLMIVVEKILSLT